MYFPVLLAQALIARAQPTTEQLLRLFCYTSRHMPPCAGRTAQTFEVEVTPRQRQVLDSLGVPDHKHGR